MFALPLYNHHIFVLAYKIQLYEIIICCHNYNVEMCPLTFNTI